MGNKPISFKDKDGNFVSAADVWNPKKLEELFTRLNPNRKLRLERERLARKEAAKHPELNEETEQVQYLPCFLFKLVIKNSYLIRSNCFNNQAFKILSKNSFKRGCCGLSKI